MAEPRPTSGADARATHATPAAPTFADLGVPRAVDDVLVRQGLTSAFPIQAATLPDALAGRDVLGRGRTGSGKTLAFALPMVARLAESGGGRSAPRRPRGLVLAPTRELARQIDATLQPLAETAGLRTTTVFGGVAARPQINALRRGADIVVACPGRLEDHIRSGAVILDEIRMTVLDEADHMADLGFLPVVDRLLKQTPARGQRLLFSATLDNAVDTLVKRYLHDPVVHSVDDGVSTVDAMDHHVMHVRSADRLAVMVELTAPGRRSVVFTRTKHRARQLTRKLAAEGVAAVELHGDLSQNVRSRNLASFSEGRATALVATDIAARGIHVDGVELVIHADPPIEHKAYLHRSGRTARAGARGTVVTLATDEQRSAVGTLGRRAGITATVTRVDPGHPLIGELAPGGAPARPTRGAAPAGPAPGSSTRFPSDDRNRDRPRRGRRPQGQAPSPERPRKHGRKPGAGNRSDARPAGRSSGGPGGSAGGGGAKPGTGGAKPGTGGAKAKPSRGRAGRGTGGAPAGRSSGRPAPAARSGAGASRRPTGRPPRSARSGGSSGSGRRRSQSSGAGRRSGRPSR